MAFVPDISIDDIRLEILDLAAGEAAFLASMDRLRNGPLQVPPFKDPVEWIFENITLPKSKTSRPGPMRLTVYQRELARCLMDPSVDEINVLKGVQVGYSRTLAALQLYGVSYLAIHVAIAQPTKDDAKSYFKDMIAPLFDEVDAAKAIVRTPGRGEIQDTIEEHRYSNGAILRMRGADNPDSLRRFSSEWNFADEVDAASWQDGGGNQQGSKFSLFKDRGTDFLNSKFVAGSTPLMRDTSLIWKAYSTSDQRKLEVRCPHCGTPQVLRWGNGKGAGFHYTRDDAGAVVDCWYQCIGPKACRIDEVDKEEMVEGGVYKPTNIPDRPGHVGLHWPAWHSMSPGAAWTVLAQRWVNSQGDPKELQTFVNNVMAEPWDDLVGKGGIEAETAHSLAVPYPAEVPDDVVVLTVGGDTQSNKEGRGTDSIIASRELSVVGWSVHRMPRVIGHWVIPGEPGDKAADEAVDAILNREFSKANGKKLTIMASAVDMGGHYGDQTKAFCAARYRKRVWAIKGHNTRYGKRLPSVWPRKASRSSKSAGQFFTICSQGARDAVGRMLNITGPGRPTFPASLPASYFEGIAGQKYVVDEKTGLGWWDFKNKKANSAEEWMCLAYAYAALCGLQASRPEWRDLNLAAQRQGISLLPPHDPETGEVVEVSYDGPDRSAQSVAEEAGVVGPAPTQPDGAVSRKAETLSERAAATRPAGNAVGTPMQWKAGRLPGTGRTPRSAWMSR